MAECRRYLEWLLDYTPEAYSDYILMTQLWHCTPTVFEEQSEDMIRLHISILSEERRAEDRKEKRAKNRKKALQ